MYGVEVSTVVYRRPREIYDFLLDFQRYAGYSEHLEEVACHGDDGSVGTRYDLTFSWRTLSYTVRSRVTDLLPPNQIDWRIVRDGDARGYWAVAPEPESAPDLDTPASRVRFYVEFTPDSIDLSELDLPSVRSFEWLADRVGSVVEAEARRVVERIVADLDGDERRVEVAVHRVDQSSNSP